MAIGRVFETTFDRLRDTFLRQHIRKDQAYEEFFSYFPMEFTYADMDIIKGFLKFINEECEYKAFTYYDTRLKTQFTLEEISANKAGFGFYSSALGILPDEKCYIEFTNINSTSMRAGLASNNYQIQNNKMLNSQIWTITSSFLATIVATNYKANRSNPKYGRWE